MKNKKYIDGLEGCDGELSQNEINTLLYFTITSKKVKKSFFKKLFNWRKK